MRTAELRAVAFESVEQETIRWKIALDSQRIGALYGTFSQVARLKSGEKERFLQRLTEIVDHQFGGQVERTFLTPIYLARRP